MKKVFLLLTVVVSLSSLAAQSAGTIGLDLGLGLGTGVFFEGIIDENNMPDIDESAYNSSVDNPSLLLSLATIRIELFLSGRYYLTDKISVGAEVGYNFLPSDADDDEQFIDIPLYIVGRYGNEKTFAQAFAGYYLNVKSEAGNMGSFAPNELYGGPEIGVKGALGGFFLAASYIFNPYYIYPRFSLGYSRGFAF